MAVRGHPGRATGVGPKVPSQGLGWRGGIAHALPLLCCSHDYSRSCLVWCWLLLWQIGLCWGGRFDNCGDHVRPTGPHGFWRWSLPEKFPGLFPYRSTCLFTSFLFFFAPFLWPATRYEMIMYVCKMCGHELFRFFLVPWLDQPSFLAWLLPAFVIGSCTCFTGNGLHCSYFSSFVRHYFVYCDFLVMNLYLWVCCSVVHYGLTLYEKAFTFLTSIYCKNWSNLHVTAHGKRGYCAQSEKF